MTQTNWKKTVSNEWVATGGGFDYYITYFRSKKDPTLQIELWEESNNERKHLKNTMVNLGRRDKDSNPKDDYESIQGDYIATKEFKTFEDGLNWLKSIYGDLE